MILRLPDTTLALGDTVRLPMTVWTTRWTWRRCG